LVNILQFSFSLSYTGPKILLYTFLSKMFDCFPSLFVSVQVSDAHVNVLSIVVFFSLNFSFFDMFLFLKNCVDFHYKYGSTNTVKMNNCWYCREIISELTLSCW